MIRHFLSGRNTKTQPSRSGSRDCRRRRFWGLESLEDRMLLAADFFTVTNTSGSADVRYSLPYEVNQANQDNNPAGSIIDFDPSVFNAGTPGVIYLAHTLGLNNTAGPMVIQGAATSVARATCKLTAATRLGSSVSAKV